MDKIFYSLPFGMRLLLFTPDRATIFISCCKKAPHNSTQLVIHPIMDNKEGPFRFEPSILITRAQMQNILMGLRTQIDPTLKHKPGFDFILLSFFLVRCLRGRTIVQK
jgi:hypothetical protein